MHTHDELVDAAVGGLVDVEVEAAERDFLTGFRQMAELGRDHAADRVELLVEEGAAEALVEFRDRRQRENAPSLITGTCRSSGVSAPC